MTERLSAQYGGINQRSGLMAYEPLHHKYRPQVFADLVGQGAIATTLSQALHQKRIAPAYLFCGPRGTGKTSSARILAKSLNCLNSPNPTDQPCGSCEVCRAIAQGTALDVIEIDAASNTGVDNIRELIERAQFAPVQSRYKVYVIDECLTGDTQVLTRQGLQPIGEATLLGQDVLSFNETTETWEWKPVTRWLDQGEKQTVILQTDHRQIRCTANHPIRTPQGWIPAGKLKPGMQILSPVPAAVAPSSPVEAVTTDCVASCAVTSSTATATVPVSTASKLSWLQQNRYDHSVAVAAENNLRFPLFFLPRGQAFKASSPTGQGIPIARPMGFGSSVPKTTAANWKPSLQNFWASSMGPCSVMAVSVIPTSTAAFQDWRGLIASPSNSGWNTKQPDSTPYDQDCDWPRTEAMVNSRHAAAPPVIPIWSKCSTLSNPLQLESRSINVGWSTYRPKAWPGDLWMMAPVPSCRAGAVPSDSIPKATVTLRTSSWQLGLLTEDLTPKFTLSRQQVEGATGIWPFQLGPLHNGLSRCSPLLHHQWHTNFETVQALISGQRERVYDLEVADNHNFVANGLLVHNCHMLSSAAFNALLKTLEEPPDRVVFVLATTDPQRVLPTIISRCQRFDFRRIPLEAMAAHLRQIATQEAIEITDEAIALVAQIAQGGLRDAESLLDQLSLLPETITSEAVWDLVGAVPEQDLLDLARAIAQDNAETVLDQARKLMNRGREPLIVLQSLAGFYRDLLIAKTAPSRHDLVAITEATWEALCGFASQLELPTLLRSQQHLRSAELQVKNTTQPRLWLEVTLLGLLPSALGSPSASAAVPASPAPTASLAAPIITAVKPAPTVASPPSAAPTLAAEPPAPLTPVAAPPIAPEAASVPEPGELDLSQTWQRVLNNIELRSTQMLLRQQGTLERCDRHQALIRVTSQWLGALQKKQTIIAAAFERVLGHPVEVRIESGGKVNPSPLPEAPSPPDPHPARAPVAVTQPSSVTPAPAVPKVPEASPSPPDQQPTPEALAPSSPPSVVRQPVIAAVATQPAAHPGPRTVPAPERSEPDVASGPFAPVPVDLPPDQGAIAPTDIPLASRESWDIDPGLRAAQSLAQFFNGTVVSEQDLANEAPGDEPSERVGDP